MSSWCIRTLLPEASNYTAQSTNMASTHVEDVADKRKSDSSMKAPISEVDLKDSENALDGELISAGSQHLHRRLGGKEIQLLAVGGAIGTCMAFPSDLKTLYKWLST